jgi:osmotically-inducible protein OsmY
VRNLIRVRPDNVRKDKEIAEDVRAVLAIDPLIGADEITVEVRNGNAHLYGTVGSPIEVARAGRVVSSVKGVSEITNKLRPMITRPAVSDEELEDALEEAFLWSPYVDPEHVTARIRDGIVTLEGRVTSWRQLYTAVRLSLEAGAFEVRSRLIHDGVSEYFPVFHYEDYSYWR